MDTQTIKLSVRVDDIAAVRDIIAATVRLLAAVEQSPHAYEFEPQVVLLRSAVTRYNWSKEPA